MPAVTADTTTLPRVPHVTPETRIRPIKQIVTASRQLEGDGFEVRRPFPSVALSLADPFVLLDHMGGPERVPAGAAKGTPWHPHRGFETVTYMMDGELEHRDTHGGGGIIRDGDTQWMTAGSGLQHIETPTELIMSSGGVMHGVQLWVNLPKSAKFIAPAYQDLRGGQTGLLASEDGGALVRIIAGELAGVKGPGSTYTPIIYTHTTLTPGSRLTLPWPQHFNALVYALNGNGTVGEDNRPLAEGQLAVYGPGDALSLQADPNQPAAAAGGWDVLILGGQPIREPVARYGPFVMNTREELAQAVEDFQAGRLGAIPADGAIPHR
jgi:redox-sensitive bicupin YhaK (pirin superfamily)